MKKRIVVYMGDERIYRQMMTAAKSLLLHNEVDRVYFLTDSDFPYELPDVIECVNVHSQQIFSRSGPNIHRHYGYMTLMRAALTKVFQQEDRVLLLDPDTIVVDDISPLWDMCLDGYYFAAVQETRNNTHEEKPYWNAGVMLQNLDKLRRDGMDDKIIEMINTAHYHHLEQDILNLLCRGRIITLPSEYNASFVSDPTDHPRIHHFLSTAKGGLIEYERKYGMMPWEEVMKGET
mgnify:CR=1 FL=1